MSDPAPTSILKLRAQIAKSLLGDGPIDALEELCVSSSEWLANLEVTPLESKVPGKKYFAFANGERLSRAVNAALYATDPTEVAAFFKALKVRSFEGFTVERLNVCCYTAAIAFCCARDCSSTGDKKTPGTFFEYFCAILFAHMSGVEPTTRIDVLNLDLRAQLPTDYIFDYGQGRPKYHLPVKISTRERIIQVWAHQRVLDGVYGTGRFRGIPLIMSETKTDTNKREVVEICLPTQWKIYQLHIAQLWRIFYFDPPAVYLDLNRFFPPLHVRPIGELLADFGSLAEA
jgi:hypothetical protein